MCMAMNPTESPYYSKVSNRGASILGKHPLGKIATKYVNKNPVAKVARKKSPTVDKVYRDFTRNTGY